jgi:uncharacterized protein (TIRG00374 family)
MRRAVIGLVAGLSLSALSILVLGNRLDEELPRSVVAWPLLIALVMAPASWLVQGAATWVLVRPQLPEVGVLRMTRLYLAAGFIGAVTPFGGAEIPYHLYVLNRFGLPTGMGTAVVATKGVLNVTVLVLGAAASLLFTSIVPAAGGRKILLAAIVLAAVWGVVGYLARRSGEPCGPRKDGLRGRISGFMRELREGFGTLWRREPRAVLLCGALQFVYWGLFISIGPLALMAGGWSGEWVPVLAALLVLYTILPFSPTPGGSGAAELGFAALVSPHVPAGALLGGVLIWRALTYYLPLVVGAFFLGRHIGRIGSFD